MTDKEMHFPGVQNVAFRPVILTEKRETTMIEKTDHRPICLFIKALRKGFMKR
ncbi:hypothetical protein [Shinella sedimenti]|uniref:Uncharacterized protein n=1 Tax=Shinella sedimenti TaxID=2919913 RepID=A0ABT0CLF3_9HYPH|nr:hypothetical protein [Shinella sedimenti]MCJ8149451.1 hypothetical protein [Shinella sedimenti]